MVVLVVVWVWVFGGRSCLKYVVILMMVSESLLGTV